MPRVWDEWLDPALAQAVVQEEPRRFKALVHSLSADIQLALNDSSPDAWQGRVLRWVQILNNFLELKNVHFELDDLQLLCNSLLTAVLSSTHDLEAQVRCADALMSALRQRKKELQLSVDWRQIYGLIRTTVADAKPQIPGMGLNAHRHSTLFKLAAKLRRWYGPDAVAEVWGEMRVGIRGVGSGDMVARFEALGWLALLLPTHDICKCEWPQVQAMVGEWMDCWGSVTCNHQWDALWAGLVCRVAKHDWKGAVDWQPHLPRLFTHIIGVLEVPVGNASGSSPITGSPTPRRIVRVFMPLFLAGEMSIAARTIVHLLKSTAERPRTEASSADALANVQHLVCLLEQYYHPSNTGKWTRDLSLLLKHLVKAMGKQLARQGLNPEPWQAALQPATQQALVEAVLKLASRAQFSKDHSLSDTACAALGQLAYTAPDTVLPLIMSRFRSALATATATHQLAAAISSLAYCVRPMLVSGWPGPDAEESGPQMLAEAMMALLPGIDANDEAKTDAVLHLYASILASVPRLGEPGEDAVEDAEERRWGPPTPAQGSGRGSAHGQPEGAQPEGAVAPLTLPLYADEWSDEFLSRLLALLENLDTGPGAQRGADQGGGAAAAGGTSGASAFLVKQGGLLGHTFGMLLLKLPVAQAAALARRLSAWVLSSPLPSVESEVVMLVAEAASACPGVMIKALVQPLIKRIDAELPEGLPPLAPVTDVSAGSGMDVDAAAATTAAAAAAAVAPSSGHPAISFAREAALRCHVHVLCDALVQYPGASLLPLLPDLMRLADKTLAVPLAGMQASGSHLVSALCQIFCRRFAWVNGPQGLPPLGPRGVELWVDKEAAGWVPPLWQDPTPEQLEGAQKLLQRYLLDACAQLDRLSGAAGGGASASAVAGVAEAFGGHNHRMRLSSALSSVVGALTGFNSCLREFDLLNSPPPPASSAASASSPAAAATAAAVDAAGGPAAPLCPVGGKGALVGAPGTREAVAACLARTCGALSGMQPDVLSLVVSACNLLLLRGSLDHRSAAMGHETVRRVTQLISEPPCAAAAPLGGAVATAAAAGATGAARVGAGVGAGPLRRRLPRWLTTMRMQQAFAQRASFAAYRGWVTPSRPTLACPGHLPPAALALLRQLSLLALHRYRRIRNESATVLESVCKRWSVASRLLSGHILAALGDVDAPDWTALLALEAAASGPEAMAARVAAAEWLLQEQEQALFARLAAAASGLGAQGAVVSGPGGTPTLPPSSPAPPSSSTPSPELLAAAAPGAAAAAAAGVASAVGAVPLAGLSAPTPSTPAAAAVAAAAAPNGADTDRDGRCRGACQALSISLPLWRTLFRDGRYFVALLHACMASRAYNTTPVQMDLGNLITQMLGRFLVPPSMQPGVGAAAELSTLLLHLGRPGALRAPWRYTVLANVLALMLMPPATSQAVVPYVRHHLELVGSCDVLGLRQVALGAIFFNVAWLVESAEGAGATAPALAELRAWLAQEGNAKALLQHLVLDHTQLDAQEDAKGKRGNIMAFLRGQAGRPFEESVMQTVMMAVDRADVWPESEVPEAVRDGLFSVNHARLVQLLCRVAPAEVVRGLAPLVADMVTADKLQAASSAEKAEQATAAEVLSGLIAAAPSAIHTPTLGGADPSATATASGAGATGAGDEGGVVSVAALLRLLSQAMAGTTLELSESWAVAARFSLSRLLEAMVPSCSLSSAVLRSRCSPLALTAPQAEPVLSALLDTLAHLPGSPLPDPTSSGAGDAPSTASSSSQLPPRVKFLRYLLQLCKELSDRARRPAQQLPPAVLAFWSCVWEVCQHLIATDNLSLREVGGTLLAQALAYFPLPTASAPPLGGTSTPAVQAAGGGGASSLGGGTAQGSGGGGFEFVEAATGSSTPMEVETGDNGVLLLHRPAQQLEAQAHATRAALIQRFAAAADAVQGLRPSSDPQATAAAASGAASGAAGAAAPSGGDAAMALDAAALAAAAAAVAPAVEGEHVAPELLSVLGLGLQLAGKGLKSVEAGGLREVLLPLLPHLFKLQELAGPVLQKLAAESQLALVLLKYIPLERRHIPSVVDAIREACCSPLWSSRAAGLLYTQYFWFRQCFLLDDQQLQALKDAVLSRLPDSKPEVRTIAAATLAGMIKGLPQQQAEQLRKQVLADARRLLAQHPKAASRAAAGGAAAGEEAGPRGGGAPGDLLQRHAAVLGLKAFLMSSPYDTPAWMPEVLMALVPGAGSRQPAAVRSEASLALSEFKRTHEADSLEALRARMGEDDWDSLQAVTSSASYFA